MDGLSESENVVPETQLEDLLAGIDFEIFNDDDAFVAEGDNELDDCSKNDNQEPISAADGGDTLPPSKSKLAVKGMNIVDMNEYATIDVMSKAKEMLEKKKIVTSRAMDLDRQEREHHYLRWQLARRLENMDKGMEDDCFVIERDRSNRNNEDPPSVEHQTLFEEYMSA